MTITADKVRHSDMTKNLGTDVIAVDAQGNVLTRASSPEAAMRAAPDAVALFSGEDFASAEPTPVEAQKKALEGPFAAIVANVDPAVMADYEKPADPPAEPETPAEQPPVTDGSAFDRDGDGKVGGSPKASRQRKPAK